MIFTVLIAALFSFHAEFVLSDSVETEQGPHDDVSTEINTTPTATNTTVLTSTTPFPNTNYTTVFTSTTPFPNNFTTVFTSTTPSPKNYFDNVSIQDVLSSDMNANEKIEKKIIDSISLYASDCGAYKKIDLSTEGFTFPGSSITIDLGSANAIFYNIRIYELSQNSSKRKLYSTSIECDSTRTAKVEVKLLKDLEISADLKVTKIRNSTSGSQSPSDILDTGSMSLTLKNNSISKLFYTEMDEESSIASKMIYSKSVMSLIIAKKFQMPIHKRVETFFDEVEPSLSQFLGEQLDEELAKNNISAADSCSNFISTESFLNNNTNNNFYIISDSNSHTFEGISLNSRPILIDGLLSFNNIQLIILESEISSPDIGGNYFHTTPSYDDPEMEEIIVKIKTNELKGKMDWSYNSKQKTIFFTLEFIQFEVKVNNSFQYGETEQAGYDYNSSESYYTRSNRNETNVSINLGNIQINSSESCTCAENESEFVNYLLSEYLKIAIADSLKNSLSKRIKNQFSLGNCA